MLSPAFPVGSFSYSHGLEWAISNEDVSDGARLKEWLAVLVRHGSVRDDAVLLAQAYRAETPEERRTIAEFAQAFQPSAERAIEAKAQGAAFLRAARLAFGRDIANDERIPPTYPVAVGRVARLCGLPLHETLLLFMQAVVANLVSVGVRFVPLGQSEGQRILADVTTMLAPIAIEAAKASFDDLGGCAMRWDLASLHHETMATRIYRT